MSEWDNLQARAEKALEWTQEIRGYPSVPSICALIRDLLAYATTVSQERDHQENMKLVRGNMLRYIAFVTTGDENGDAQLGVDRLKARAERAEQERDAAISRAEQAEDLLREWLEADFYSVRSKDLRTRTRAAFPDETMEQQEARAARRKP